MKNSHRTIAAVVCALALLALPAQAAPASGKPSPPAIEQLGSWLGTLWESLVELITGPPSPPATSQPPASTLGFSDGGSCIDPNGCAQAH